MVAISSTVGKAENSSGAWMNSDVIRISTEKMIEMASAKSSSSGGSGRISTTRMVRTPPDRAPAVAAAQPRADPREARQLEAVGHEARADPRAAWSARDGALARRDVG